jgi:hypothetical protein
LELEGKSPDGRPAVLPVHLRFRNVGTMEGVLTNKRQPVPWKIKLKFNTAVQETSMSFKVAGLPSTPVQALKLAHFIDAVSRGGSLVLRYSGSGIPIIKASIPTGVFPIPDQDLFTLLTDLQCIFEHLGLNLVGKFESLSVIDLATIRMIATMIEGGGEMHASNAMLGLGLSNAQTHELLDVIEAGDSKPFYATVEDHVIRVAENSLSLGAVLVEFRSTHVPPDEAARLKCEQEESPERIDFAVHIRSTPDNPFISRYLRWFVPNKANVSTSDEDP